MNCLDGSGSSPRARGTGPPRQYAACLYRFIPARAGNGFWRGRRPPGLPVHPRARGERTCTTGKSASHTGSSPRARGTGRRPPRDGAGPRFIPARAGNGTSSIAWCTSTTVHPRARGERIRVTTPKGLNSGSSPRARGTGRRGTGIGVPYRFIPARAGNGAAHRARPRWRSVHPRARGERGTGTVANRILHGSSPRARGTVGRWGRGARVFRFIPARAGNGVDGQQVERLRHGSSPRARGTARARRPDRARRRFIPARAGNGSASATRPSASTVHPRARGERRHRQSPFSWTAGSSPRARGTVRMKPLAINLGRFIPARAGNGSSPAPGPERSPVHPRARGERAVEQSLFKVCHGSSPRARGTAHPPP